MEIFRVKKSARQPLLDFMVHALEGSGCRMVHVSSATEAPFRLAFVRPNGERMGVVAYAFLANSRTTRNRPSDEHRFQLKYGSRDGRLHNLWQDPSGLQTTLLVGIDPDRGIFVGADPVLHSPTRLFISFEFKRKDVEAICKAGWHVWERVRRVGSHAAPVSVLVGGTRENFLRYVLFEREVLGEDQGHRQLVAESFSISDFDVPRVADAAVDGRIHALASELSLSEKEILDLIHGESRLKMAVRGWVAEEHLTRLLQKIPGARAERVSGQGEVDVRVELSSGRVLGIQCKNVLRQTSANGLARMDFQRTRAAIADPCSRYYSPSDFPVVAACMHAVSQEWSFRFASTRSLDPHPRCNGKLASNVRIDSRWLLDPLEVFQQI